LSDLEKLARDTAEKFGLDPNLICALVEQESGWNTYAIRYEPHFYDRYILPLLKDLVMTPTEATSRAFSWGLLQCMGQTLRETGFKGRFHSELLKPEVGLEWGCRVFKKKLERAAGDVKKALLYWNGGGRLEYVDEVLAKVKHYESPKVVQ
jgi:soluble lytic murein transglycosylase-like protein